eukprot:11249512-Prorocentrum_lima.AAC.1
MVYVLKHRRTTQAPSIDQHHGIKATLSASMSATREPASVSPFGWQENRTKNAGRGRSRA